MAIRCAAKAVIIRDGRVLLIKCSHQNGDIYYDLPGGGQIKYESMEEAVRREVMEETGYTVGEMKFAALAEDIFMARELREKYPDYCHRIYHIFAAAITNDEKKEPGEPDWGMEKSVWVDIDAVDTLGETYPERLAELIKNIIAGGAPMYLGTNRIAEWE